MVSPKFANLQCNGHHDGGTVSTGRQTTLRWSGQQKLLRSYCVDTLSKAWDGSGNRRDQSPISVPRWLTVDKF